MDTESPGAGSSWCGSPKAEACVPFGKLLAVDSSGSTGNASLYVLRGTCTHILFGGNLGVESLCVRHRYAEREGSPDWLPEETGRSWSLPSSACVPFVAQLGQVLPVCGAFWWVHTGSGSCFKVHFQNE